MREQLPTSKRPGQRITPRHINDLSRIFNRLSRSIPGSNRSGHQGNSFVSEANLPPWEQGILEIVSDQGGNLYTGQFRYYDHTAGQWQTNTEHPGWDVDASDIATTISVSDKVVCYWNEQRGAFIPICCGLVAEESSVSSSSTSSATSSSSPSSSLSSASSTSVACRCRDGECVWEWDDFSSGSGQTSATGEWTLITDTCTAVCQPEKTCTCTNGPTRDGLFDGEQWVGTCAEP